VGGVESVVHRTAGELPISLAQASAPWILWIHQKLQGDVPLTFLASEPGALEGQVMGGQLTLLKFGAEVRNCI